MTAGTRVKPRTEFPKWHLAHSVDYSHQHYASLSSGSRFMGEGFDKNGSNHAYECWSLKELARSILNRPKILNVTGLRKEPEQYLVPVVSCFGLKICCEFS